MQLGQSANDEAWFEIEFALPTRTVLALIEIDVRGVLEELLEDDPNLNARQRCARADVLATTEPDMLLDLRPVDYEHLGIRPAARGAIGS